MERLKKFGKEGEKIEIYIYIYDFITELPSQITPARHGRERKEVLLPSLLVWIDVIAPDHLNPILRACAARS
jgi:hypothetical protein